MFDVRKTKIKIKKQETLPNGTVRKKKSGRPPRPNMKTVQIRIDKSLDAKITEYCKNIGIGKSHIFTVAVKKHMDQLEKKYRLVEV